MCLYWRRAVIVATSVFISLLYISILLDTLLACPVMAKRKPPIGWGNAANECGGHCTRSIGKRQGLFLAAAGKDCGMT